MSGDRHLRVVGAEPSKPRRRKGRPHTVDVLSAEEQARARQALRNLRDAFGSWSCLAEAMGVALETLQGAGAGRRPVSPGVVLRASKASGLSVAELLGGPAPAERCRACGQVKRRAA